MCELGATKIRHFRCGGTRGRGRLRAAGYRGGDFDVQRARRIGHADFLRDGPELRQLLDRYLDRLAARLDPQRQFTHRRSDGDRHVHGPAHLAVSPDVERRGFRRHGLDLRLGHLGFGIQIKVTASYWTQELSTQHRTISFDP